MSIKTKNLLYLASGIITAVGALANMLNIEYSFYAFALGALGIILIRVTNLSDSSNIRIRRLYRIQAMGTILLIPAGYFMFRHNNAWVICLLLSAVFDLIVSYRMPKDENQ